MRPAPGPRGAVHAPLGPPAAMAIAIAFVDSNLDRAWAGGGARTAVDVRDHIGDLVISLTRR